MKPLILVTLLLSVGCARLPFTTEPPIRVLVLNMHGANVDAAASLVTNAGADLVLVQEIDPSSLNALGTKLQYAAAGGAGGVATLARGFIGFKSSVPLTVAPSATTDAAARPAERVVLESLASLRTGQLAAINVQLDAAQGQVGDRDLARLADAISSQKASGMPFVVGGDFNAAPDHPGIARLKGLGLRDAWAECGSGDGFTYPADAPAKRIDYLFLTGDLHCSAATVLDAKISDHRPVLVTLK